MAKKKPVSVPISEDSASIIKSLLSDIEGANNEAATMAAYYKEKQGRLKAEAQLKVIQLQVEMGLDSSYEFAFTEMKFKEKQ